MVHGIKVAREIAATGPFTGWRRREVLPGPDVSGRGSARRSRRAAPGTYYHPVGTCAMGTGPDAVVDPIFGCTDSTGCGWSTPR